MIDLRKATKGRRMSKKTRKKSPKPSAGKSILARSATSAKKPPSESRGPTASKSRKIATNGPTEGTVSKRSHKPPSKALKSSPEKSVRQPATGSKVKAANPTPKKAGASATAASALIEGAKAPPFRLPRDGGSIVSLADFAGKKLVLFFYPRADTPGCTREAIDFSRLSKAFAESQTAVLGVSADPLKAQESFRNKHQLAVPLVSDEQHEMLQSYGVWGEKSMYGKTFQGILRTTVLIGGDGQIIRVWRHVKVDGHADEVLAAVRTT
jgi:thioredoxin-dependent peroxiredoxin